MPTKAQLRAEIRATRRGATAFESEARELLVAADQAGLLIPGMVLATYLAAPGEPDTSAIRTAVRERGGRVLVPVASSDRQLLWAEDDGRERMDDQLPVPRPVGEPIARGPEDLVGLAVGLVLAPALAVDHAGTRLGQGGGFFDRLIGELAGRVRVIAIVRDEEVLPAGRIPAEPYDQPVRWALSTTGLRTLGAGE